MYQALAGLTVAEARSVLSDAGWQLRESTIDGVRVGGEYEEESAHWVLVAVDDDRVTNVFAVG
jgi:hypothetical protein